MSLGSFVMKCAGDGSNPQAASTDVLAAVLPDDVYVQFKVAFSALDGAWGSDPEYSADIFFLLADMAFYNGGYYGAFITNDTGGGGAFKWTDDFNPDVPYGDPIVTERWYLYDLHIHLDSYDGMTNQANMTVTVMIDGVVVANAVAEGNTNVGPYSNLTLQIGQCFGSGNLDVYIDNVKVGTTGTGSSDLFSSDFEDGSVT